MKRAHIIFCFIFLAFISLLAAKSQAQNQIRITTNVLPPYSPYIQDYPGTGNHVQVFISNLSGSALSVRLLGKLEGDNGVVIRTSANYRPLRPLELRPTDVNRMLTRTELEGLFDLAQIEVQGMNKNELYRGLPLPEGNYQLCIQAFDNATIRPLSAEFPMGCSGLIPVRIVEPPILISPYEGQEIIAKTPQTQLFSWSAPVGILPNQVEYTLRVVELPAADINANVYIDAMVLPRSGLEVKNLRSTTYLYGPSQPPLQIGKRYAWRVQALPTSQNLNFMNEGKSPVGVFTYGLTPVVAGLEYIAMTAPNQASALRTKSMQVGNNNPLTFMWEMDKEFEEKLRKGYSSLPNQKQIQEIEPVGKKETPKNMPRSKTSILDYVDALSYKIRITNLGAKSTEQAILERQVRKPYFQIEKEDLPAAMTMDKKYEVSVELLGVSDLVRKQAQLPNEPFASKPVVFSLFGKDLGSPKDTLTITGILAFKYPGEAGKAHILPNTKVVLSKLESSNYLLTVGYGMSDGMGRYTIKVLKSALHDPDTLKTFTRCVIDPVNPFIQPITSSGAYQTNLDNTFQISRNEQKTYNIEGITWLASGYTLDLTAKQTYKNWPGAPEAKLSGQYVVIYRKTTGLQEYYKKFRLPVEGQVEKMMTVDMSEAQNTKGISSKLNSKLLINQILPDSEKGDKGSGPVVYTEPGSSTLSSKKVTTVSDHIIAASNSAKTDESASQNDPTEKIKAELKAAGYEFIGISQLKANGDAFSTTFERLVYADKSYDNYRVYCPGCGQKPDDGQAIIFLNKKETLAATPAKIEKATFNIETTEPPTMTFKGKLAYKFADPGKDGAQVLPLSNTQVHLQVVYQDMEDGSLTAGIPGKSGGDVAIIAFHKNYSQSLDTRVTSSDGSFEFKVKLTEPMQLGILPVTAKTGAGEFTSGGRTYRRTLRVIVDNDYYTSPTADFGLLSKQVMEPQGSFDFQTIIAQVRSFKLIARIKSDVTGQLGVYEQKAGIKNNLAGVNVMVLRGPSKIPTPGANKRPPADVGTGTQMAIKIKGKSYTVIASGKSDGEGLVSFPRMVMAGTENDAYFLTAFATTDGLNSSDTLEPRRITQTQEYKSAWDPNPAKEVKDDPKAKPPIMQDGTNCVYTWEISTRQQTDKNGITTPGTYLGKHTTTTDQRPTEFSDNTKYTGTYVKQCNQIKKYWIGEELGYAPINNEILLYPTVSDATSYRSATFTDEYKYFNSQIVQRFIAPGPPTINIRVVDKSDPTKGIKDALVALTYEPTDGSTGNRNKMTDENGWITTPFVLKPGKNAQVKIYINGYNFYASTSGITIRIPSKGTPPGCSGCTDCICIGELMLGQNSYYPTVLMEPNTHIVGRAIDYDTKTDKDSKAQANISQSTLNSGVPVSANFKGPKTAIDLQKKDPSAKATTTEPTPELGSGQTMEAYVQADDGYIFKTQFKSGMWKFDIDAPSTAKTLKVIPVNISYFNEERNIKTELPKPTTVSTGRFNINAGDINIYQRDHRITFKIFEKSASGKAVAGAQVRLFGKSDPGFVFGPSDQNGVVETKFKNVSVDNLYVEITAPGYVTQTVSVTNEESKTPKPKTVLLEPAAIVNGTVVTKSAQGADIPLEGALVFVSAGKNAPVKYSTVSKKDGSFSLSVDRNLSSCTIEATYNSDKTAQTATTYIGASENQAIPQAKGQSLKLVVTTFDKFNIASLWGFPITIEKMDSKTMKVTGVVDLSDPGFGPFGTLKDKLTAKFENVVFKANPDKPQEGIPASETVELADGVLDQLVYHTTPSIVVKDIKYNVKLTSLENVANAGKLKITRTPGTSKGKIIAQAQVIDNSFNFSENLFNPGKDQLFLSDSKLTAGKPAVVAFDSEKSNIKWTDFTISQKNGSPMKLKFLAFDAVSALEGSRLVQDEIHLSPEINCHITDAIPSEFKVKIGNLVIKNNTIDKKSGETPLTFPLAGNWSVEVRDWELDYKKGGFYSTKGVVKTGKVDIPIKEFNLRSDFFKLDADPKDLELAGVAKLNLGGKAYFGYDSQTGSDMKGHWSMVIVPEGNSPAATLPAGSLPGLTDVLKFQTVSLLDNGQDVVTFGSGNKSFRYFNIIDVRPTTIATGPDWFEFDSGLTTGIPNAPKDVSMRLRYYKSKDTGKTMFQTMIPGDFSFETSGYLNFYVTNAKAADGGENKAIYFADGIIAMKGRVEEPGKLSINNVLLVHTAKSTHITHNRNLDLNVEKEILKLKDNPIYATNDDASNKTDYATNKLSMTLAGSNKLADLYCHQNVTGAKWGLMTFSGVPSGFQMLGETYQPKDNLGNKIGVPKENRLAFTAHGEIIANDQKVGLDGIDTPLGGLSLVYDMQNSRFTGSIKLMDIPIPPCMTFENGMAQVRVDGNGFYLVASGTLTNVPLLIPVTMKAGLMLGYYNSRDLGDATQVLFGSSHRKSLPCSFNSSFKGIYATGEIPVPFAEFKSELSIPAVGGYKIGLDAYVDAYAYANYLGGAAFDFGAGVGVGAHAYAYGSILSLSAGGEVHINGGIDTGMKVDLSAKMITLALDAHVGAGVSVTLEEEITGIKHSGSADFCIGIGATGSYTIGGSVNISPSFTPSFSVCPQPGCSVNE